MFGYGKKKVIVDNRKKERSIVVATIKDEKSEKQSLMDQLKESNNC
jgi:hypothetical protein